MESITAKQIAECAYKGHSDAIEIYSICGKMLGKGLSLIIDILNPDKIVIGSIFARSNDLLVNSMKNALQSKG